MRNTLLAFPLAVLLAGGAAAAPLPVDVALVLAADVSGSMSGALGAQRDGFVAAFRNPEIARAIADGPVGKIAVAYVEWAGAGEQWTVVPWTIVDAGDAATFADRLAAAPVNRGYQTSISGGLMFAARLLRASGVEATRRTIDVSGDGPNNSGLPLAPIRDALVAGGITINGLPLPTPPTGGPFAYLTGRDDVDLASYYSDCVIGGAGSFVMPVNGAAGYSAAIRRKLALEIAGRQARVFLASFAVPAPPASECSTIEAGE